MAIAHRSQLESRLLAVLDARVVRSPVPRRLTAALACGCALVALPAAAVTITATSAALQQPTREPDTLDDSIANPSSERVPLDPAAYSIPAGIVNRLLTGPDAALAAQLVTALARVPSHEADLVRDRAAWALAQATPDGRIVDPLLAALDDRDWRIQAYAAWTLAIVREPRALPRLVPLLEHPVWRLRAMAAHTLARYSDTRARDPMYAALSDPAWQVRLAAVEFFTAINDPNLESILRPRLDDRHIAVRDAASRARHEP